MRDRPRSPKSGAVGSDVRHGLARTLSRMGYCSRSEAERLIRAGRVALNGSIVRAPELPVVDGVDNVSVDGCDVSAQARVYIVLHKPRGLVVSASDERGRETVYSLLSEANLPWLAPVGRLDQASEGLLLMSNDPSWSARITDPVGHVEKTYRVQVRGVPSDATLRQLRTGVRDRGELLAARCVATIGGGDKNAWLEIVLDEGKNRQIRRMLAACGHDVLRLLRVAIGSLPLGDLRKGGWRHLTTAEVSALGNGSAVAASGLSDRRVKPPAVDRRRSRSPLPAKPRPPR